MRGREERSLGVTPDRGIGEFPSRVAQPIFCRGGVAGRNRPAIVTIVNRGGAIHERPITSQVGSSILGCKGGFILARTQDSCSPSAILRLTRCSGAMHHVTLPRLTKGIMMSR